MITQFNNFRLTLLADEEIAKLYITGSNSIDELIQAEHLRFKSAVGNILSSMWGMYTRTQNGTITVDHEYLKGLLANLALSPGIVASWKEQRKTFPADFREYADTQFDRAGT